MAFTLLNEVNVDTTPIDALCYVSDGSSKTLIVDATSFGSGTVTLEVKRYGGQWATITLANNALATFTANAIANTGPIGEGLLVRAKLTGATNPVKVNAFLS